MNLLLTLIYLTGLMMIMLNWLSYIIFTIIYKKKELQDVKKKCCVISHPIKSVIFVQIQNRFGFSKYSLGDARC